MSGIVSGVALHDLDPSRHLVESFPNMHSMLSKHWLPMHWAILGNLDQENLSLTTDEKVKSMKEIASYLPDSSLELDKEGRSYLHYACRLNSQVLVEKALEFSQEPVTLIMPNANGALPLHNVARFSNSEDVLDFVIKKNPSTIRVGNNDNTLPLHWASAKSRNVKIILKLIEAFPDAIRMRNNEGSVTSSIIC